MAPLLLLAGLVMVLAWSVWPVALAAPWLVAVLWAAVHDRYDGDAPSMGEAARARLATF